MYGRVQGDLLLRMHYGGSDSEETEGGDFDEDFEFDDESFDDEDFDFGDDAEAASSEDAASAEDEPDESKGKDAGGKEVDGGETQVGFLWGLLQTPPSLMLGGGFRNLTIYTLGGAEDPFTLIPVMMADLYMHVRSGSVRAAASAGIAKVEPGSPHARPAQVTRNQGDEYNMVSRTHWLGFDLGSQDQYLLRLGRLNLPFGVRIPEHTMWAREATRSDRESDQQHGVALAYTGESFRTEVMGIAGNYQINPDKYRERGYSLFFEVFPDSTLALGASSMLTFAAEDRIVLRKNVLRQAHGVLARVKLAESLSLLAEANVLMMTDASTGYTGFAQLGYEVIQGLHLMATGEFVDQGLIGVEGPDNLRTPGAGEPRFGAWATVDWFFYKQFELRLDAVYRQEADTQLLAQLHFYL